MCGASAYIVQMRKTWLSAVAITGAYLVRGLEGVGPQRYSCQAADVAACQDSGDEGSSLLQTARRPPGPSDAKEEAIEEEETIRRLCAGGWHAEMVEEAASLSPFFSTGLTTLAAVHTRPRLVMRLMPRSGLKRSWWGRVTLMGRHWAGQIS